MTATSHSPPTPSVVGIQFKPTGVMHDYDGAGLGLARDTYLEPKRELPKLGVAVTSLKGDGVVIRHNILKQTAIVRRAEDGVEVEATLEDLLEKRAD